VRAVHGQEIRDRLALKELRHGVGLYCGWLLATGCWGLGRSLVAGSW
jgi:hypothetical protein